ncbi:MAG: aspartate kinase [Bacteroidales bacterium]|nr:aspartate kinase [Bacteroidales bacterium]
MKVFKFGGASVNSTSAVRNMAEIVRHYGCESLVIVVSAMGKTTNRLEQLVPGVRPLGEHPALLEQLRDYHLQIIRELFPNQQHPVYSQFDILFGQLQTQVAKQPTNYNFDYDQTVCFGELLSTTIISHYLNSIGLNNQWVDVRNVIRTDNHFREGIVDFDATSKAAQAVFMADKDCHNNIFVTQGFIAGTADKYTTTLGREGSDYSAAILSYCLNAESMTIWKDVPGFLNADPKYFRNTIKIEEIPYNEAIELAYYGASVIHSKTVKPIQNKDIVLNIRSFVTPEAEGSKIGPYDSIHPLTPLYIFKNNQTLLSILPKDFSFIAEDNLHTIFATLANLGIRVNLMQNSALSFSICIDDNEMLLQQLQQQLSAQFRLRYNRGLQLITIRYYTQQIIDHIVSGRPILLQQRSRTTTQILVQQHDDHHSF